MTATANQQAVIAHCREQARFCQFLGSPFTAALCEALAVDIENGGPVAALTRDWPGDPKADALSLRIAGYLHHSVLTGQPAELARIYPGTDRDWSMDQVWPVAANWLAQSDIAARAYLSSPPQTNEVRRSIALLPGFLQLATHDPRPMHLLELGASAGLNQNWDRFSYHTDGWSRTGDSAVAINTDWRGAAPEHTDAAISIASRAACDQNPIDVSDPAAALRLKSYAWPDQPERLARLDSAVALAVTLGTSVEKADAGDWLAAKLAARPATGLTVVFHSVFLQYPPVETRRRIIALMNAAGAEASPDRALAWLTLEPVGLFDDPELAGVNKNLMASRLQTWPGGEVRNFVTTDGHVTRAQVL